MAGSNAGRTRLMTSPGHVSNHTKPLPHARGTVRWFDAAHGYGFVACDGGGPDCLMHESSIRSEDLRLIEAGTRIDFDVLEDLGGLLTVNVRLL